MLRQLLAHFHIIWKLQYALYDTVIKYCGLVPDFDSFVDGGMFLIENNGMDLSGGQRQRIVWTISSRFWSLSISGLLTD